MRGFESIKAPRKQECDMGSPLDLTSLATSDQSVTRLSVADVADRKSVV